MKFIKKIKENRVLYFQTAMLYLTFIMIGMRVGVFGPVMNDLAGQTGVSLERFSLLFIAGTIGGVINSLFGARLLDRFAPRTLYIFMVIIMISIFTTIPFVGFFPLLFGIYILQGSVNGMFDAGGNLLVAKLHQGNASSFISGLHFSFGVGAFLIPLLTNGVRAITGNAIYVFWIIAAVLLIASFGIPLLPKSAHTKNSEAKEGSSPLKKAPPKVVLFSVLFFFFFVAVEITFGSWINNYSMMTTGVNAQQAALVTSLFFGCYTISRLVYIPLLRKFDNVAVITFNLIGASIAFFLLLILPASVLSVTLLTAMAGLTLSPVMPVFFALIEKMYGFTGAMAGYLQLGASMGIMLFPWVIGSSIESFGSIIVPTLMLINVLIAFGLGLQIFRYNFRSIFVFARSEA